ncbi:MAG: HesA/MoeB/ThiF family protein [Gemmataceae bacterium]|nr:HesA/MoeB/ThiF family protein [Gemmataceae bacterium]
MDLGDADFRKYQRQMTLPGFGESAQRRLKNSGALVARVGGVGGTVALYLAAAGIGRLTLMHGGNLTWTNLNRQVLMTQAGIGTPRADQLAESLRRFNPDVELTIVAADPTEDNVDRHAAAVDVICDCPPTFEERFILNRASVRHCKPMIEAAMSGMEAHLTVLVPGETPCLQCLVPEAPVDWSGTAFPVLGAVSGTVACLAAIEAVKVLTGFGRPLKGELLALDTDRHEYRKYKLYRNPDCKVCGHLGEGKP